MGVDQSGNVVTIEKHQNSHRFAPLVWEFLLKKYNLVAKEHFYLSIHTRELRCNWSQHYNILWKKEGIEQIITKPEWWVLYSTYDRVAFHKSCLDELRAAFLEVELELSKEFGPTHLSAFARVIRENKDHFEFLTWDATSISDVWWECVRDETCECEENKLEWRGPNILFDRCTLVYEYLKGHQSSGAWERDRSRG